MNERIDSPQFQLPRSVVPRHYDILMVPDFGSFRFSGRVVADVEVREPVDRITVHSLGLKISRASVVDSRGERREAAATQGRVSFGDPVTGEPREEQFTSAASLDEKSQTAVLSFDGMLAKGDGKLTVEYEGSLVQPSLEGFYRSAWIDDDKNGHWVATTQFEATHARRAFPCWDEPAAKATYTVTFVIDEKLTVLSNMRAATETVENGRKTIVFAPTPRMSTYLLAWCVGEFESSQPAWANGKELRIWSVPGKNALKTYAFNAPHTGCSGTSAPSAFPTSAGTRSTWSPSRSSARGPWRIPGSSPTAPRRSSSTSRTRPSRSCSALPRSSSMSWRTCGSATSSPWPGGTVFR